MVPKPMLRMNISRKRCLWLTELKIEHTSVITQDISLQKDVVGQGMLYIYDKNTQTLFKILRITKSFKVGITLS